MWDGRGAAGLALALLKTPALKGPGASPLSTVWRCECGHQRVGERTAQWQGEDLLGYFAAIMAYA